ncbi:MAG: DUF4240 domain-containing protein [Bacilli bacterium]
MNVKEFWKIIEETKPMPYVANEMFINKVNTYSNDDIKKAQAILNKYDEMLGTVIDEDKLYDRYGIADDHYLDFKHWVISKGFEMYKAIYNGNFEVLEDYLSIEDYVTIENVTLTIYDTIKVEFEGFSFIDINDYEEKYTDDDYFGYDSLTDSDIIEIEKSVE